MEKSTTKLAAYSTTAVAVISSSAATSAAVVYTDVSPDSVITLDNEGFALDLDGLGVVDFQLGVRSTDTFTKPNIFTSSYEFNRNNSWKGYISPSLGNSIVTVANKAQKLGSTALLSSAAGFAVPSSSVLGQLNIHSTGWITTTSNYGNLSSFTSNSTGNFTDPTEGYIGLKFKIGTDTHYGWVYVTATDDAGTIKVLSYAYEDIKDYGISAGMSIATGIENRGEKATLYSFGRDIHVKSSGKGTAEVYNLTGQKVASTTLSKGNSRINVRGTSGVYIVKITENGRTSNHKVHLN